MTYKIDCKEKDYLFVKDSQIPNAGKGLFTAIKIYKDEIISIFKGEQLNPKEAKKRADAGEDAYFINMIDGSILDSMHVMCFAKYANDASAFTAGLKIKNNADISLDDEDNVCIVAKRNIKIGEEIFCSYGKKYWERHSKRL